MSTLYASFNDAAAAERAAGALLDHGAKQEDLSMISNRTGAAPASTETIAAEQAAKTGISTTTAGDVAVGAVKGTAVGTGVGAAAFIASLFIPGVGLVTGGGALAMALAAGAGTILAGAAAGSVAGLLADQGIPDETAKRYTHTIQQGGAILAIAVPTGDLDAEQVQAVVDKYGALDLATYNSPRVMAESITEPPKVPMVIQSDNPDIEPVMVVNPAVVAPVVGTAAVVGTPIATRTVVDQATGMEVTQAVAAPSVQEVIDPETGTIVLRSVDDPAVVKIAPVVPVATVSTAPVTRTVTDAATGEVVQTTTVPTAVPVEVFSDPMTGAQTVVETNTVGVQSTTLPPTNEVVMDSATGTMHRTVGRPTVVNETDTVVVDPATGLARSATIVEEQRSVVTAPLAVDEDGHLVDSGGAKQTTVVRDKHIEVDM